MVLNLSVALNLYRRHRKDCEAGRAEDSTSGEFAERGRGWKRCGCVIFCSGTLAGRFGRTRTGATTWDSARSCAAAFEAAGSWDGEITPNPPQPDPAARPERTTIAEATRPYLANRKTANLAPASLRKYGVFTRKLEAFADARGYVMLDQFTAADIDTFYSTSGLGIRSRAKMLESLRTFWKFCVHRELVAKSPVSPDLKPPIGANRIANKAVHRRAARRHHEGLRSHQRVQERRGWENRFGSGNRTGDDLKDFIWFMTHTGLRISDVVLFDIDRLHGNEVFLRAKKNGGEVFVWIPDWLRDRLQTRQALREAAIHG